MNRLIGVAAFAGLTLGWIAFGAILLFRPDVLDSVWEGFRAWPLAAQVVVGLLVLPLALGLWIWELSWALWLRVLLVILLAVATVLTFFPRRS